MVAWGSRRAELEQSKRPASERITGGDGLNPRRMPARRLKKRAPMNDTLPTDLPPLQATPSASRTRRGVLNATYVRVAAFAFIGLSIFASAVVCLLAVWDYADRDTAWKALASLGIIAASMAGFVVVNESFGRSLRE